MSNATRRRYCRRRLAALTFLSNISLDGTHKDTPLGVLNLNVQIRSNKLTLDKQQREDSEDRFKHCINYSRRLTISDCSADLHADRKDPWSSYEDRLGSYADNRIRSFSKSKERVQKFVTDTKAKLCTLSQKRKHLVHQKSTYESLGLPCGLSTESLTYVTHSRRPSMQYETTASARDPQEPRRLKPLKDQVRNERLVFCSTGKVPFAVFSLVPFQRHSHSAARGDLKPEGIRRRHNSSIRQFAAISDGPNPLDLLDLLGIEPAEDGQDISFAHFLNPANALAKRCRSYGLESEHSSVSHHTHASGCLSFDQAMAVRMYHSELQTGVPSGATEKINAEQDTTVPCRFPCHTGSYGFYNPNLLDDPDLIAGKHSTLLSFPSYMTSIINYVKPSDLKKDLNDKFKEKFPHLCLTLSKLRSLKKEMYLIARHECSADLSVVAQAFVYFEKLVLKMLVNKQNRKLCAGACLMLSAKLNDIKGPDLRNLLEKIETVFRINRKDLIFLEFRVLVALEFSLHLSSWEVLPHYQRLLYSS